MDQVSSQQFPQVYDDLGIDTNKLGCIMADTELIEVSSVIHPEDLYVDPEDEFAQGIISEDTPHVTLLNGLLSSGQAMRKHVDSILSGRELGSVQIVSVTAFAGNPNYAPLVAEVSTDGLDEANARLRLLPHINTFPAYRPHITLAYLKPGADVSGYVDTLNRRLALTSGHGARVHLGFARNRKRRRFRSRWCRQRCRPRMNRIPSPAAQLRSLPSPRELKHLSLSNNKSSWLNSPTVWPTSMPSGLGTLRPE